MASDWRDQEVGGQTSLQPSPGTSSHKIVLEPRKRLLSLHQEGGRKLQEGAGERVGQEE